MLGREWAVTILASSASPRVGTRSGSGAVTLDLTQLFLNMLLATVFSVLGFVLLFLGFKAFDRLTPGDLSRRIFDDGNVAAAIMAGAFVIAVAIVIASSIHG
ncbi:MAG: DUF350 domain-containing protein [Proteobacteria bacterium]|jgi:putative membrane protein|nr:DUF350 domain-containing protein [Pseudomonadota bacterium]